MAQHDAAALLLELAAAYVAASALTTAVSSVLRWVTAQWGVLFGVVQTRQSGPVFDRFTRQLEQKLRGLPAPDTAAVLEHARRARVLGVVQGFRETGVQVPAAWLTHPERISAERMLADLEHAGVPHQVVVEARKAVDRSTRSRLSWGRSEALDRIERAAKQVHDLDEATLHQVMEAMASAQSASRLLEATAKAVVVKQLNEGILAAATAVGARVFWVAEADACRWCASAAGTFPGPDGVFRMRGFGARGPAPYRLNAAGEKIPLRVPPAHNHCRCRLGIWRARRPPGPDDLPTRLRHEASARFLNPNAVPTEPAFQPTPASQLLTLVATRSRSRRGRTVPGHVVERARRTLRASIRRRTGR